MNPNIENRCVCCGEVIPEGRHVCPSCEIGTDRGGDSDADTRANQDVH